MGLSCNRIVLRSAFLGIVLVTAIYFSNTKTVSVFGQTFSQPINLSDVTHGAECGDIKVSGSNVYVAWSDNSIGSGDVLFRKSSDGGETFGIIQDLSDSNRGSSCPRIAVSSNNVYVVWNEGLGAGQFDVFFRRSIDEGENFDPIKNLSHNPGDSCCPEIAISGKRIHVAWDDDSLPNDFMSLYTRSSNSGTSFTEPKNLVNSPIREALDVQVAASGDFVYVVWTGVVGNEDSEIYLRISKDGGNSFGSTKNLSNDNPDSGRAALRATGNFVYVTWESDQADGNREILFKRSTNKGSSFSSTINLSNNPSHSMEPVISTSGDNVYICWEDETNIQNSDILFRRSLNQGANFGHLINLSNNPGISTDPAISRDGSNVQIVWKDNSIGNYEILFKRSTDFGAHFGKRTQISNSPEHSQVPKTVSTQGIIYIIWIETGDEASNLLYVRSVQDILGSTQNGFILPLPTK